MTASDPYNPECSKCGPVLLKPEHIIKLVGSTNNLSPTYSFICPKCRAEQATELTQKAFKELKEGKVVLKIDTDKPSEKDLSEEKISEEEIKEFEQNLEEDEIFAAALQDVASQTKIETKKILKRRRKTSRKNRRDNSSLHELQEITLPNIPLKRGLIYIGLLMAISIAIVIIIA